MAAERHKTVPRWLYKVLNFALLMLALWGLAPLPAVVTTGKQPNESE